MHTTSQGVLCQDMCQNNFKKVNNMTTDHPIKEVIKLMKGKRHPRERGQSELARRLGISQQCISKWILLNRPITPNLVLKIEEITEGKITRHQLRPDLYPKDE